MTSPLRVGLTPFVFRALRAEESAFAAFPAGSQCEFAALVPLVWALWSIYCHETEWSFLLSGRGPLVTPALAGVLSFFLLGRG